MDNLRADIEDRFYKPEKNSHAVVIFSVCITAIITGGGIYLLTKPSEAQIFIEREQQAELLRQQEQAAQKIERPAAEHKQPVRYEDVTSPYLEQWERESKERKAAQAKKQTVFNDDNYRPKGAVNSIPAPQSTSRFRNTKQQRFSRTHTANWTWETQGRGLRKAYKRGVFYFEETEKGINTANVCSNYKYGSLIYRDCRKAAKKWFSENCSSTFQAACGAKGMIP